MTPEERASAIVGYLIGSGIREDLLENVRARLECHFRWAIEQEREACKLIAAKHWVVGLDPTAYAIADEIESRGKEAGK